MSEQPKWTDHPVDVLKWFAQQAGREIEPEWEARIRAVCDEPARAELVMRLADGREISLGECSEDRLPESINVNGIDVPVVKVERPTNP